MSTIAVIEDSETIRDELIVFLQNNGFSAYALTDFKEAAQTVLRLQPDCVLLDLNLPGIDGNMICRDIKKQSEIAVIVVTSRSNDVDELIALNLGADDFIEKPYNLQILLARMRRLLDTENQQLTYNYRSVHFDLGKGTISRDEVQEELTKNEMRILLCLFQNKGQIVTREQLMNYLWNESVYIDDNTLTVNINRLRKKLMGFGCEELIETKRGMGYLLHELD